jgi:uncharacterized protein involved in response to NO
VTVAAPPLLAVAAEELEHTARLLNGMKSELLAEHLPTALPAWTRLDAGAEQAVGAGMAMSLFGGATAASASLRQRTP